MVMAAGECCAEFISLADFPVSEIKTFLAFAGLAITDALLCGFIFWFCFFFCQYSAERGMRLPALPRRRSFSQRDIVSAHGCRAPPL